MLHHHPVSPSLEHHMEPERKHRKWNRDFCIHIEIVRTGRVRFIQREFEKLFSDLSLKLHVFDPVSFDLLVSHCKQTVPASKSKVMSRYRGSLLEVTLRS